MDHDFFQKQIDRLVNTYGEKAYSSERVSLIWDKVQDLSDKWLERTTTKFLMNSKQSPMPTDFIEQAVYERDRTVVKGFDLNNIDPRNDSIFSKEEITEIIIMAKGICSGALSKEDGAKYEAMLKQIIRERSKKKNACPNNCDNGILVASNRNVLSNSIVFKCNCNQGRARIENYSTWSHYLERNYSLSNL